MLSNEALRVLAAANEALEARRAYIQSIRERIAKGPKDQVKALLAELDEFDNSFTELFMKMPKREPEIK